MSRYKRSRSSSDSSWISSEPDDGSDPSSPISSEASVDIAMSSHTALLTAASSGDGALLSRLEANTVDATSHVAAAVSTALIAVHQCGRAFVSTVRQHATAVRKRLEMQEEELDDTVDTLKACLQQLDAGVGGVEHTLSTITTIIHTTDYFASPSIMPTSAGGAEAVQAIIASSCLDFGIDTTQSLASHASWMTRSETSSVSVPLSDATGEPVYGILPSDVAITVGREAVGWVFTPVSVADDIVTFDVTPMIDCSDVCSLHMSIAGASWTLTFKALLPTVASALSACTRARDRCIRNRLKDTDLAEMRTACTIALSSIDVADAFCNCIVRICNSREVYRWMCSAAGVIPTLVSAMNNHGADSQRIAAKGCLALASLVRRICRDAEIVVECGGLDAILAVMTSHPSDADVQRYACRVLYEAAVVSQAALLRMRASAAVALINTAKVNHPTEGWDSVRRGADDVLSLLLAA